MSEANRVSLKFGEELGNYGDSAAVTTWETVRYNSQSIAANPQTVISNELRADRMVPDLVLVGSQVGGEVAFELAQGDAFDNLLEAALMGNWDASDGTPVDELRAGITERSFSMEAALQDWSPEHYLQYKGMRVGGVNLNFAYGSIVTGSFQFAGKEATDSGTSLIETSDTENGPSTSEIMNASADVSLFELDDAATYAARSVSLSLTNNLRAIESIGTVGATNQAAGRSMLTGSVEMYFDEITQYAKLLGGTSAKLEITVTDGTNTYAILIPKIKWQDGNPAVTGVDTDLMLNMNFTAIYDSGIDSQISIVRS